MPTPPTFGRLPELNHTVPQRLPSLAGRCEAAESQSVQRYEQGCATMMANSNRTVALDRSRYLETPTPGEYTYASHTVSKRASTRPSTSTASSKRASSMICKACGSSRHSLVRPSGLPATGVPGSDAHDDISRFLDRLALKLQGSSAGGLQARSSMIGHAL